MSLKKIAATLIAAGALVALIGAAACGDDDDQTSAADAAADTTAVEAATEDVLVAIQQRDQDRLQDLTGDRLQQQIRDQDLDQLATCVPDGASLDLLSREVVINGDTATVTGTFQITEDGEASQVEKVWALERQDDGTWALSALPDCPFQTPATANTAADTTAVEAATEDVLVAIQQRDQVRLRDLTGGQLQQQVRDQDLQQLATCVPGGGTLDFVNREVVINGDTATVTVTFQIPADGEASQVEKIWEFERQDDGAWALRALPECPFQ